MGLTVKEIPERMDVNLIGSNFNDTVLYLVRILQKLGKRVLIRDITGHHSMYSAINEIEGANPGRHIIDYSGVGYTFSLTETDDYDLTIRLYDADMYPFTAGTTLIVTDESKKPADELEHQKWEMLLQDGREIALVVKNYTGACDGQFKDIIRKAGIKNVYPIPLNVKDAKLGVLAEYRDNYTFKGLSNSYKDALSGMVSLILTGKNRSDIDIAIREAGKGRTGRC